MLRLVDELARRYGLTFGKKERKAVVASGLILGKKVILTKPQTYMNLSGTSVEPLMVKHSLTPADLILVYDELDLPFGTLRLKAGGGHAGHNGLRSIFEHTGAGEDPRARAHQPLA